MNKEKFGMIFLGPFPEGNVSTLRIYSYCKALAGKGYFVKVYIIAPTNEAKVNKVKKGIIEGIHFEYICDITWGSPNINFISKILTYFIGLFKTVRKLKYDNISVLLSYHNELISNIVFKSFCKLYSLPFVLDKTEYPISKIKNTFLATIKDKLKLKFYDGIITITKELVDFYKEFLKLTNANIFHLPMTIDCERFNKIDDLLKKNYITVLFGTHNRDSLYESVYSYILYKKLHSNPYKLLLIGDFNTLCVEYPENNKILELIKNNNCDHLIEFKGLIPSKDIPNYLISSKILMTTPQKFISGGFPTKLGEYLLSGTPVITTPAGEIPSYLIADVDVFMPKRVNDVKQIADLLYFIHENPEHANNIANAGKLKAHTYFNAATYINKLICFLQNLKTSK